MAVKFGLYENNLQRKPHNLKIEFILKTVYNCKKYLKKITSASYSGKIKKV